MKTAHTPGPWIHRTRLDDGANIGCKDGYAICDMAYKYSSISKDELDADAKLIAAAPDLLAALTSIVTSLADQDDEGLIEHAQQMIDARAAIAKATGVAA